MRKQAFILEIDETKGSTSWEGRLQWVEGNKEWPFRSMIELLHLVDATLDGKEEKLWDYAGLAETSPPETVKL